MSREGPHVLFCAFAEVPGPSSAGTRTAQLMTAFGAGLDVDGLSVKGRDLAHIERIGNARLMRVPVEGKGFAERLAAYRRALQRQLSGDPYDLVWCGDLFSGHVAAAYKESQGFALIVDAADLPAESFAKRHPVDARDQKLRAEWSAGDKAALRSATAVLAPSRAAARALASRVDARRVHILGRAVDRSIFAPPSVEIALEDALTILVVGGREGGPSLAPTAALLEALAARIEPERARLALAGTPGANDDEVKRALAERGLEGRVILVDIDAPARLASTLCDAHVVVVPSVAELGVEPFGVPHRALEAMACRRATVLTGPEAAFADTLVAGEDALIVKAGAPKDVALAVEKLLDAPALREAIAQAGARRVEQEADLRTKIGQLSALLADAVGLALAPRAEATDPMEPNEPSKAGDSQAQSAFGALPPPPVDDATDSGRVKPAEVLVPAVERVKKPEVALADPLKPRATETLSVPSTKSGGASAVFTDEGPPRLAPAPPSAPSAVDLGSTSVESSNEPSHDELAHDTIIAPPPAGLQELLAAGNADDGGGGADDWYGDTRIDGDRFPEVLAPGEQAVADTKRRVTTEPSTSSLATSKPSPAGRARSHKSEPEPVSLPDGDPWSHDTIADARPVFTSDDPARHSGKQAAAPSAPAAADASASGKSFLVDPELFGEAEPHSALDDATIDDARLPRDPSSES